MNQHIYNIYLFLGELKVYNTIYKSQIIKYDFFFRESEKWNLKTFVDLFEMLN